MNRLFEITAIATLIYTQSVIPVDAARVCNYDCDSPFATKFGNSNMNSQLFGFPDAQVNSWTPVGYKNVCKNGGIMSDFQPLVEQYSSGIFHVGCPNESLKLIQVDGRQGTVEIPYEVAVEGLQSFRVTQGKVAIVAGKKLMLVSSSDLSLIYEIEFDETITGAPFFSNDKVHVTIGTKIHSVAFDDKENSSVIDTGVANSLGFTLVDGSEHFVFCSSSGVVRASSSGAVALANLSAKGLSCADLILPREGQIMVAAQHENGATTLYDISSDDFGLENAVIVRELKETVYGLARVGFIQNNEEVAYLSMTTSTGAEVIADKDENDFVRGNLIDALTTPDLVKAAPSVTGLGEPAFVTKNQVGALQTEGLVKFYDPSRVFTKEDMDVLGDLTFATAPVLLNIRSVAVVSVKGDVILYSYCKRWEVGKQKPEKYACPVGDLPDASGLDAALVIIASASTALCLPMSVYLCRKGKFDGHRKENGMTSN